MATAEDVFYLFEHNKQKYDEFIDEIDFDHKYFDAIILPDLIGNQYVKCNLKTKCYIKPKETCSICLGSIMTKNTAFITECGHAFHRHCIYNVMLHKWNNTRYTSCVKCPLCRSTIEYPELLRKYRLCNTTKHYYNCNKNLDQLEEFWLTFNYKFPNYCMNGWNHYLGCVKTCKTCQKYVNTGCVE